MENLLSLIKQRQSDRAYDSNRPVEAEKLDYILEAARLAPSACNAQPWKLIVVNDPDTRQQVASTIADKTLGMNHFAYQAPVLIVLVEEKPNLSSRVGGWIKQKYYPDTDLGILAAYITLAAAEQGLGSCIVGWFAEKKLVDLLGIPSTKRPFLVVTLGYSTQPLREKKRKTIKQLVSYDHY